MKIFVYGLADFVTLSLQVLCYCSLGDRKGVRPKISHTIRPLGFLA